MRADRMLAILMLLQQKKAIIARELADELDVSVRTIYRDMDALSAAGIPVYAERGAGGGCRLLEDYRTDLTGLTSDERQALHLLAIPEPLAALETGQTLRNALLKLFSALPAGEAIAPVSQKIHLDWSGWEQGDTPEPFLRELYRAVDEHLVTEIHYRFLNWVPLQQAVRPYGLVAKAGVWYLVYEAGGRARARRISELTDVHVTGEQFQAPQGFALAEEWKRLCSEMQTEYPFRALVRIESSSTPYLTSGIPTRAVSLPDVSGWQVFEMSFIDFESARARLLARGGAVEVLEPEALRLSLQDYAKQILSRYADQT